MKATIINLLKIIMQAFQEKKPKPEFKKLSKNNPAFKTPTHQKFRTFVFKNV